MLVKNIVTQVSFPPSFLIRRAVNAWWRRQVAQEFLREVSLSEGASVIDIGCKSGRLTRQVAGVVKSGRVVGIDPSERMIRRAIKRCGGVKNVEFYVGEAEALPWEGESFDCATCLDSFYDYPNPGGVLTEMLRVLKPGGKVFLGVRQPVDRRDWKKGWGLPWSLGRQRYGLERYVRYFVDSGFLTVREKARSEYLLIVGTKG